MHSPPARSYSLHLHLARWSSWVPLLLGFAAMAGWLASGGSLLDVGPFYLVGMLAVGLAFVGFPLGLIASLMALKRGAPIAFLGRFLALWSVTVIFSAVSWWTGRVLTDLQVFRIHNLTSDTVEAIELWCEPARAASHRKCISRIAPGETRLWALRYGSEGCATFRWQTSNRTKEPAIEERVFLGIGQPTEVTIELQRNESYTIKGEVSPRWMWVKALKAKWAEKMSPDEESSPPP